jgi:oligopeptide/dipeptide ABC transporter ATP-binding protein
VLGPSSRGPEEQGLGGVSSEGQPLVEINDLTVEYRQRHGSGRAEVLRAVDGISFTINRNEILGLVGESGCGKSTTGLAVLAGTRIARGSVTFDGHDLSALPDKELRRLRRRMQIVFQDPYSSLNPRMSVAELLGEPLVIHALGDVQERRQRILELLDLTGLPAASVVKYPHEFSGGQRQRLAIARALATRPDFLVLDEPLSALDLSVQAQIVNLLLDIQEQEHLTYLLISHDLAAIRHVSDRVAVMYLGKLVELGSAEAMFDRPLHPYTESLLVSALAPLESNGNDQRARIPRGDVPSPLNPPSGCRFHPRCPFAEPTRCPVEEPNLRAITTGRAAACHWIEEIRAVEDPATALSIPASSKTAISEDPKPDA